MRQIHIVNLPRVHYLKVTPFVLMGFCKSVTRRNASPKLLFKKISETPAVTGLEAVLKLESFGTVWGDFRDTGGKF